MRFWSSDVVCKIVHLRNSKLLHQVIALRVVVCVGKDCRRLSALIEGRGGTFKRLRLRLCLLLLQRCETDLVNLILGREHDRRRADGFEVGFKRFVAFNVVHDFGFCRRQLARVMQGRAPLRRLLQPVEPVQASKCITVLSSVFMKSLGGMAVRPVFRKDIESAIDRRAKLITEDFSSTGPSCKSFSSWRWLSSN